MIKYPKLGRFFVLHWFNRRMRGIQILFLFIPILNWIMEIGVRWSKFADHPNFGYFLLALLVTFGGVAIAYLDIIWCLFFHHLIFAVADDEV